MNQPAKICKRDQTITKGLRDMVSLLMLGESSFFFLLIFMIAQLAKIHVLTCNSMDLFNFHFWNCSL